LIKPLSGLQSVLSRIPRTKGLHLDEAILRVARLEAVAAEYPFRPTREEETGAPAEAAGPSSITPGSSRPMEDAKIAKTTTPRGRITPPS
jgi:hypothetical protein